jgi:hypothetical protein
MARKPAWSREAFEAVLCNGNLPIEELQLWRKSRIATVRIMTEKGGARKSTSQGFEQEETRETDK